MRLLEAPSHLGLAAAIGGARFGRRRRGAEAFRGGTERGRGYDRARPRRRRRRRWPRRYSGGRDSRSIAARSKASTPSRVPRIGRPIGWSGQAVAVRRSNTRSSGVSSTAPISWTMTFFSRSSSSGSNALSVRRSPMTSSARSASLAQNAGEIAGPLDAGLCVEVAADVLDRLGDLAGASAARALERHVLDEMREPVLACALVARSRADEHADRRRLHMGRRLGDDGEPRGKARDLNAHAAARAVWRTIIGHRPAVVGQDDDRFLALHQIREALRQRGPHAGRALDGVGKLRRMGRRESDDRRRRRRRQAPFARRERRPRVCGSMIMPLAR